MLKIIFTNILTGYVMGYIEFENFSKEVIEKMPPCFLKGFIDEYQKNPDAFRSKYKEILTISLSPLFGTGRCHFGTGRCHFYLPNKGLRDGVEPMSEYLFYDHETHEFSLKIRVEPTHSLSIVSSRHNVVHVHRIK